MGSPCMKHYLHKQPQNDDGDWIALPGLFEQSELTSTDGLEIRAHPLILSRGRVFYGVYVRDAALTRSSAPPPRARAANR